MFAYITRIKLPSTEIGRQQEELAGDLFGLRGVDQDHTKAGMLHLKGCLDTQTEMSSCIGYIVWKLGEMTRLLIYIWVISL